jgi:hypothetical protein
MPSLDAFKDNGEGYVQSLTPPLLFFLLMQLKIIVRVNHLSCLWPSKTMETTTVNNRKY